MRHLIAFISAMMAFCLAANPAFAQEETEQQDSLVRLINAESLRQYVEDNITYRKVIGKATFLHHDTYLLCDTALWNVDSSYIDAWGNVKILQQQTVLESEKLIYLINDDLAQFRGNLVQLQDKDMNTLRTHHLDYNTRDSIAIFREGASMRDKDGQIIESDNGIYDSKGKTFTFSDNVNMFTDSIFVKTSKLVYDTDKSTAYFNWDTNAWKEENMLSSHSGWYDRARDLFFFNGNVHLLTEDQECWSDSLFFNRTTMNVTMFGNAQVSDTTRNVHAVAGHVDYVDSLKQIFLTRKPAVISMINDQQDGKEVRDTVYFGADSMYYFTQRRCDIDSAVVALSNTRIGNINIDPVGNFRKQAAEEAAKAAAEAAKNDPNAVAKEAAMKARRAKAAAQSKSKDGAGDSNKNLSKSLNKSLKNSKDIADSISHSPVDSLSSSIDSLSSPVDSLANGIDSLANPVDSLVSPVDSLESPVDSLISPVDSLSSPVDSLANGIDSLAINQNKDTTDIGFLRAIRNVRLFKKNMQVICDSLAYTDLDSLAFLYKSPIVWNEIKHQYMADSIALVIKNNTMKQANLMSNAFIHIQEDTVHYDQIKGAEMTAYFDADTQLERFDALGGASALFFLEENGAYATVNKKEAKMLSAEFKNGDISRIYYFDAPKSDGYPVVQLSKDDKLLKGFSWQPDKRPIDRYAITDIELRSGERSRYERVPHAKYDQTDIYFPGYIEGIYKEIITRDSLNKVQAQERRRLKQLQEEQDRFTKDSLAAVHVSDSLANIREKAVADSLKSIAVKDSLARVDSLNLAKRDSIAVVDSLRKTELENAKKSLTREEKAELKKAQKEAKAKAKLEAAEKKKKAREEKWRELDIRDSIKAVHKAEKKAAKLRKNKLKALRDKEEEAQKEHALLEKYKARYREEYLEDQRKGKKLKP